jgi:hypothetical protein
MAFVSIPKDLQKIKSRVAMNLTGRQLICFGVAAACGIPAYIFTRGAIGNSAAALLMIGAMLPLFFLAMYEKDGQPAEKLLRNFLRCRFYYPGRRPYKTENLYDIIRKEGKAIATESEKATGSAVGKRARGKEQQGRPT